MTLKIACTTFSESMKVGLMSRFMRDELGQCGRIQEIGPFEFGICDLQKGHPADCSFEIGIEPPGLSL